MRHSLKLLIVKKDCSTKKAGKHDICQETGHFLMDEFVIVILIKIGIRTVKIYFSINILV